MSGGLVGEIRFLDKVLGRGISRLRLVGNGKSASNAPEIINNMWSSSEWGNNWRRYDWRGYYFYFFNLKLMNFVF